MARSSVNFLPSFYRTDKNTKFLTSTLDQFIEQPQLERLNGYIGSKLTPTYDPSTDVYVTDSTSTNRKYILEPGLVITNSEFKVKETYTYDDLINQLAFHGVPTNNLNRLFKPEYLSFDPQIAWDKLVNYREYFWLPTGPDTITITGSQRELVSTYTVTDSKDGFYFIFTPDGLSESPLLTLYRGVTYVFNVSSKNKLYIKTQTGNGPVDQYTHNIVGNGTKNGQIIFTVDESTPALLFYASDSDLVGGGQISIKTIEENSSINVDKEIVGKASYKSGNGIEFVNGLKITFGGDVIPVSYRDKTYFVEGVGSAITLVDYDLLSTPEPFGEHYDDDFDVQDFDKFPFDTFQTLPIDPAYITINRASRDLNPWSRYNRWFHSSVLKATAQANNKVLDLPIDSQAKRPIVEFKPNLQLFNFGTIGVKDIALIDTKTTDAFSNVEGKSGYHIDNVLLEQGQRVIFNADTDPLVRGRIFEIDFVTIDSKRVIALVPTEDSIPPVGAVVSVELGKTNSASSWWFDGTSWIYAQQRTTLNQAPLFDVVDPSGISYGNKLYYTSNFQGTKLFGYKVGTGTADSILGFPLAYQTAGLDSSYLFSNYFNTDEIITIYPSISQTIQVSTGMLVDNTDLSTPKYVNTWVDAIEYDIPVVQFDVYNDATSQIEVTVFDNPGLISDLTAEVFVNSKRLMKDEFTLSNVGVRSFINFTNPIAASTTGNKVEINLYTTSAPNSTGTYLSPLNLTNNPVNGAIAEMTLSELADHVSTMINRDPNFDGAFPGASNLDSLASAPAYGSRMILNYNPLIMAQYFITKKENNVINAINEVCDDYNQFKLNLIKTITQLEPIVSAPELLDQALASLNQTKNTTFPYFLSDMVPTGTNKKVRNYVVTDTRNVDYALNSIYDPTTITNKAVLVYLNDEHLLINRDYVFNKYDPTVTFVKTLTPGDKIVIVEYNDTDGSYIAPTPTKLGLYPKFEPGMYLDTSYANGSQYVIQGHDGSLTVAFGDYRDEILLEYEKRIFNNIKTEYDSNLFDINSVMPSVFRKNNFSYDEVYSLITNQFKKWTNFYGIDYEKNLTYDVTNHKTYNYKSVEDTIFGGTFNGSWRAIYKMYFDTDRPETHPWEMLGLTIKPTWWDSEYGPAPYTSGNQRMWDDLETGYIAQGPNAGTNSLYARPGLSKIIPVDESGNLIDIRDWAGIGESGSVPGIDQPWAFGQWGPVENAWRRSSNWPFAMQLIMALTKPADYCGKLYDTSRLYKNLGGQYFYLGNPVLTGILSVYSDTDSTGEVVRSAGYNVMVVEVGNKRNGNYVKNLINDQIYGEVKLVAKLGGFVNKDKLNIVIDSVNLATQNPSPYLPAEDFQVHFNTSNPIKTVAISGVIVIKSAGTFIVRGYDTKNLYFNVNKPIHQKVDPAITVGGTTEPYLTWTSGQTYIASQVVLHESVYYRVQKNHVAGTTFNLSYFTALPGLPTSGGVTVTTTLNFETEVTQVPYGTAFASIQEVTDFLFGYGKWLSGQGFVFNDYNSDFNQVVDWTFTVKEFVYWTTQNWADNSVITLSPFANQLQFKFTEGIVDNILDSFNEYSLLKADGMSFPADKFSLFRDNGIFTIKATNTFNGIYFARLNVVQKEHVLVLNNTTIFNDIVYKPDSGYRQQRIKLEGFRTANWQGDFFSPGFIFDSADIKLWESYADYLPGDVVKYVGKYYSALKKITGTEKFDFSQWFALPEQPTSQLIPNFDYKINQFEDFYSLDIDNFDAGQQKMAQHLTGYSPRSYLDNIFDNPISQYKFYQGYIKEKGTLNAITKLAKAASVGNQGTLDIAEEWAFRSGAFGAYSSYNEIEIPLKEKDFVESSQLVQLVSVPPENPDSLISYVFPTDVVIQPQGFIPEQAFITTSATSLLLPHAGYVRLDDVQYTSPYLSSLNTNTNQFYIAQGDTGGFLNVQNVSYVEGDKIWVAFNNSGDWDVYRYTTQPDYITETKIGGSGLTFSTNRAHDLSLGDVVAITRIDPTVNGVYTVSNVLSLTEFAVSSNITSVAAGLSYGVLAKFDSVRFKTIDDVANLEFLAHIHEGETLWIDDMGDGRWGVIKKVDNYAPIEVTSPRIDLAGQRFGDKMAKQASSSTLIVSADDSFDPVSGYGRIFVYETINGDFVNLTNFGLNAVSDQFRDSTDPAPFGDALFFDETDNLIFVSSSNASAVAASNTTTSAINVGAVKISSFFDSYPYGEIPYAVLTDPEPSNGTRFGSGLYAQRQKGSKILLVGSPKQQPTAFKNITTASGRVWRFEVDVVSTYSTSTVYHLTPATTAEGPGGGASFDVTLADGQYSVTLTASGNSYTTGSSYVFSGDQIGGVAPRNNLSIIVNDVDPSGAILGFITKYIDAADNLFSVNISTQQRELPKPPVIRDYGNEPAPDEFGYAISGSADGSRIAVSSPGFQYDRGAVHVYTLDSNNNYQWSQTIPNYKNVDDNPEYFGKLTYGDRLGDTMTMSDDGNYLFVSSNLSVDSSTGPGKVWVYELNSITNKYDFIQVINNPSKELGLNFGKAISINSDNTILSITSQGTILFNGITFDNQNTTFDGDSCRIGSVAKDAGSAYVFNRYNKKFLLAQELLDNTVKTSSHYGTSVIVNDHTVYVGSPGATNSSTVASGAIYLWNEINPEINSWQIYRKQEDLIDTRLFKKAATIDSLSESVVDYLDIIDPLKGNIPGLADRELRYKVPFDPAVYAVGNTTLNAVVDTNSYWGAEHVGELWWDLSTVKFVWYEQGDAAYRKATWGQVFPGVTVDIYEWVSSSYTPSQWAAMADTNPGLAKGISGQPLYPSDNVYSTSQYFDKSTNQFATTYYFWVKNKTIVPSSKDRKMSAAEVSRLIENPRVYGLEYAAVLSPNAVALTNFKHKLISDRIYLNIGFSNIPTDINKHTEWELVQEDSIYGKIPNKLERKFVDSLIGKDSVGNLVPDPALPQRQRYGIEVRPRQSMFVDRTDALHAIIEYTNSILLTQRVRGFVNFSNLNSKEEIPNELLGQYDQLVETVEARDIIVTKNLVQARLVATVLNGKIISVSIDNPGFGYKIAPAVQVLGANQSPVEIRTTIDELGRIVDATVVKQGNGFVTAPELAVRPFSVIVQFDPDFNNKWSLYSWAGTGWVRTHTQDYDTTAYWSYVDWKSATYNSMQVLTATVDEVYQLDTLELNDGDYVRVNNPGDGYYVILSKTSTGSGTFNTAFDIEYIEKGTIQISNSIWDITLSQLEYDEGTFDQMLFDQTPEIELKKIVLAIKDDLFINENRIYWNKIFFKGVRYALTEQKFLDWAFKTTFINVKNLAGVLDQRPTYQYQNPVWYENYLKEVKPYHTKIRNYQVNYNIGNTNATPYENANSFATDFDVPSYYNKATASFESVTTDSPLLSQYPWKSWADNHAYSVESISVVDAGDGYKVVPEVRIIPATGDTGTGAKATAYIAYGKVSYIEVTDPGQGYTQTPSAIIVGGGDTQLAQAKAYVHLTNDTVRSTKIAIKFDRISASTSTSIVGTTSTFVDNFTANGTGFKFTLTWYASSVPLDSDLFIGGILALESDYYINNYTKQYKPAGSLLSYTKKYSEVVLNSVPPYGTKIAVSYKKNPEIYSASERIRDYYNPQAGMPGKQLSQLMEGVEYPGVQVQTLPFSYDSAWDVMPFGESSYANDIKSYIKVNIAAPANTGSNTLQLTSLDGVVLGQFANLVTYDSLVNGFTGTTVNVIGINTSTNVVTFNSRTGRYISTAAGNYVELWNFASVSADVDTVIDGGDLAYTTGLGLSPNDIILDGDGFLTPFTSHAPEEVVPGEIQESLSISVFTKSPNGSPLIVNQSQVIDVLGIPTLINLNTLPPSTSSVLVSYNNVGMTYGIDYSIDFLDNMLVLAPQSQTGTVAITVVGVGGTEILGSQIFESITGEVADVEIQTQTLYSNINSSYVTVNGETLENTSTGFGYTLEPISKRNKLAKLIIHDMPVGLNIVQAWYFQGEYKGYSEIKEQIITVESPITDYTLLQAPGNVGPLHGQAIVELNGLRLTPPATTYYEVSSAAQLSYEVRPNEYHPAGAFSLGYLEVYVNGSKRKVSQDWRLENPTNKIIFANGVLQVGDVIAIVVTFGADYLIYDNIIKLSAIPSIGDVLKITTFTNHDTSNIRTEVFPGSSSNQYRMSRPTINDSYVWVSVAGKSLINKRDYRVLSDLTTVEIDKNFEYNFNDPVVITSFSTLLVDRTVGYRMFRDIFGTVSFKRISAENTAYLLQDLSITDTEIYVTNSDILPTPVIADGVPGVVFIQGERIEYFTKSSNTLGQLRRTTLGTGARTVYQAGTAVLDQGKEQNVPTFERTVAQNYRTVSTVTNYVIQTTGTSGITLLPMIINGVDHTADQVAVIVAGRLLSKTTSTSHNFDLGYDSGDNSSDTIIAPAYTIDVATQTVLFRDPVPPNTDIAVVKRFGLSWYSDGNSLLDGSSQQAQFLQQRQSGLPDKYQYGKF